MYNPKSKKAEEFINNEEILESLKFAKENKNNRELIESIINKAKNLKGLTHREAILLLDCELEDKNEEIYALAKEIKEKFYGNRIVMFAPLYLSNYCVNGCVYCPYHHKNKHIRRKKLSQEEIKKEVASLRKNGIAQEDFERARRAVYGRAIASLGSVESVCNNLVECAFSGRSIEDAIHAAAQTTKEDVQDRLEQQLWPEYAALSVVLPA